MQESLLDVAEEPALGALGARGAAGSAEPRGAWVDLRPGWLAGSGAVFGALVETVPWRAEKRHMYDRVVDVPRLLCFYGEDVPLPHPLLAAALAGAERALRGGAGRAVPDRGAVPVPGRAGQRGLARRHDRAGLRVRTPWWRSCRWARRGRSCCGRGAAAPSLRYEVGHGDLLVMGGSCQRTWEHAVPKTAQAVGPRISVQFRPRGVR